MSSIGKTTVAAHAEGSHFNNSTTSTTTTTTTSPTTTRIALSSSPSSSQNSKWKNHPNEHISFQLSSSSSSSSSSTTTTTTTTSSSSSSSSSLSYSPSHSHAIKILFVGCFFTYLLLGILVLFYFLKKWTIDRRRTKERQQQIQEHTHGFHLWKNRLGLHRFVTSVNQLPSNKPRHYPLKVRFAPTVGVKFIPLRNHPINKDAWNLEYHRQVAVNNRWQQEQWSLETAGKNKHRRLVVSSIAMMEFRRTVLSILVGHARKVRTEWTFRKSILPRLMNHSHRLRWKWALKRHHAKAPFQEIVLSALPGHHQRLRLKGESKAFFSRMVLPMLVDHCMQLRVEWALNEADRQLAEMDFDFDDSSNNNTEKENDDDFDDANFEDDLHIDVIVATVSPPATSPTTKKVFSLMVLPRLVDHCMRLRVHWALQEADRQLAEMEFDFDDFSHNNNDKGNDDDVDATVATVPPPPTSDFDDCTFEDDIQVDVTVATVPTTTTSPTKKRPSDNTSTTITGGATIWIEGRRRSTRLQPRLGTFFENGIRRSARFL